HGTAPAVDISTLSSIGRSGNKTRDGLKPLNSAIPDAGSASVEEVSKNVEVVFRQYSLQLLGSGVAGVGGVARNCHAVHTDCSGSGSGCFARFWLCRAER